MCSDRLGTRTGRQRCLGYYYTVVLEYLFHEGEVWSRQPSRKALRSVRLMYLKCWWCVLVLATGGTLNAWRADAAVVRVQCPSTAPTTGTDFVADISIDVGASPLGAYTFAIHYDPTVAIIGAIKGGSSQEFSSPPISNGSEFSTGRTRFLGLNSSSLTSPTGVVSVAQVTFHAVGAPGSSS